MKNEEVKKEKKINKKKILIISIIVIAIIGAIILFFVAKQDSNSITSQFDKILNSNNTEIIFFERQGNFESDEFKEILDTDLKEQGITYTTIDLTNATYEELEHIKLKFNISSEDFNYYIVAIRGSENLFFLDYSSIDRTMFTFANKGLLKDSTLILNEYYYKLGKEALEKGVLGEAKRNFEKCKGYLDTDEILNYKRFYLVDNDFEYNYNDVRLSFNYLGGYSDDGITVSYQDCRTLASCFDYRIQQWDAIMLTDNQIKIRALNSSDDTPFNDYLNIEILSQNQIKLGFNGKYYTLTKIN